MTDFWWADRRYAGWVVAEELQEEWLLHAFYEAEGEGRYAWRTLCDESHLYTRRRPLIRTDGALPERCGVCVKRLTEEREPAQNMAFQFEPDEARATTVLWGWTHEQMEIAIGEAKAVWEGEQKSAGDELEEQIKRIAEGQERVAGEIN